MKKAMMRAIMAMGMDTPMPAFAPAERLAEVVERLVEVVERLMEVVKGLAGVVWGLAEVVEGLAEVVERLVEVVNSSNISEANNFNITVSVLCQATGTPSQRIVLVGATVINDASLGKPPEGQFPLAIHTFVKVVVATL
jgi:prophage DNA circulation protein